MGAIRSGKREEWVSAAERLVSESADHVDCPECSKPGLQVRDVEYGWGPRKGVERYLICTHCGAYNAVNLQRAGQIVETTLRAAE
jgi:hypothetical protein